MIGDIEFWTTLLVLTDVPDAKAIRALRGNCTHVAGRYWIMEGDTDYLRAEDVRFREVAEGAVGSLGGLSERELRKVCADSYGVIVP